MGKIALYRKYRSQTLGEIVGQSHIVEVLSAAAKSGEFSHAYLFTGQRGTGKTSIARILAHLINDLPYTDKNQHLDIVEINAADKTGVEDIRELIDKASLAPMSAKYKIYIIDEVHQLSTAASNALLKTLEEPPAHVIFILATTDPQKILPTVLSRTQRFHFRPVSTDKVAAHLRMIADKEKIHIDDDSLYLLAERGNGSVRDSITLLDQLSGTQKKIVLKDVEDILGLAPQTKVNELISSVMSKDNKAVIKILTEMFNDGITPNVIVDQLVKQLSIAAVEKPRLFELIEKLIEVSDKSSSPEIKLMAVLINASVSSKSVATKVDKPVDVVVEAKAERHNALDKKEPVPKTETADVEMKKEPSKIDNVTNINKISDFNWDVVVAKAKEIKPMTAGLIEKASYELEDDKLLLYYRLKFHYDKMSVNSNRQVLIDAIAATHDSVPEIKIVSGSKPKSEVAERVAAIMGGGEMI